MGSRAQDHRDLIDALASVASDDGTARMLAKRGGMPPERIPRFHTAVVFWTEVVGELAAGTHERGVEALRQEAAKLYPHNPAFAGAASDEVSRGSDPLGASTWPAAPLMLVGRDDDRRTIADALLRTPVDSPAVVVRGWPGVGKSTLLSAMLRDDAVAAGFRDIRLWIPLGPDVLEPKQLVLQFAELATPLGLPALGSILAVEEAVPLLRERLHASRHLLVIDDAFSEAVVRPWFRVLGPHGRLLVSTREPGVANALCAPGVPTHLEVLSPEASIEIIRRLCPQAVQTRPQAVRRLVETLEFLPLALQVAGRMLASELAYGLDIDVLLDGLEPDALLELHAPFDREDRATGSSTVDAVIARSTVSLDEVTRRRFSYLDVLAAKPAVFSIADLDELWSDDAASEVPPLTTLRTLSSRGLIEPLGSGRFQVHALVMAHARRLGRDE